LTYDFIYCLMRRVTGLPSEGAGLDVIESGDFVGE
jgi:hypothetical protein